MIAMPYTVEHNDVPLWVVQNQSSDEMLKRIEATLEVIAPELADNPQVLTLALHPHVVGVAHRAHYLARVVDLLRGGTTPCSSPEARSPTGSWPPTAPAAGR